MKHPLVVGLWGARMGPWTMPCAIGRGGIGEKLGEGDGVSPKGHWHLKTVYYRPDREEPLCPGAVPIGLRDAWCDDPFDPRYNGFIQGDHGLQERLRRADPLYDLVGVLDFNMDPVRPHGGSAIFLHIWRAPRHPTAGCVAMARPDLRRVLRHLGLGGAVMIG